MSHESKDYDSGAIVRPDASVGHFPAINREALAVLTIEAELCQYLLGRTLQILAERKATPFTIRLERGRHLQRIDIEMFVPSAKTGIYLLHAVRRIHNIRSARLLGTGERDRALPLSAKM